MTEEQIERMVGMGLEESVAYARAHGARLAMTPATFALGCRGCRDGDNVRHPGVLWRCDKCPVRMVRRRLGLESGAPVWPDGGPDNAKTGVRL